ncbi:MBOAT family protein [Stieleria sp. ICT_E10.1]|uniref:MBOAT family O-acyltransferase n=1 Tax=Stieleria sedimenti TaxID=2976331 RepID=UPI00217FCE6F|nr:MBOAT family O-acyltransferase [Stieleria sedimenti]MCS7467244.1 MBOAT family protein [Stieleria sedimenti]
MLFNSPLFLIFFAVTYVLYLVTRRSLPIQNTLLLIASYVFYGAWDWRFLSLIWASTAVDYFVAIGIEASPTQRRRWLCLIASVAFNLGLLGFFKYYDFGISSFATLLSQFGFTPHLPTLRLILPVGISFYTFQTMSYSIDVYRGKCHAERDPLVVALYVAFFPQLVAGPIERACRLMPQLKQARVISRRDLSMGMQQILLGYFKKVVLADSLAPMVDQVFASPHSYSGLIALLATLGFAVQIYGDFAGYSLIARGLARLMGIELMVNFRFPYFAESPRDFWRRWHISLSSWLQEYLYLGLGGSRRGRARTCVNLMVTMVLGGLWHGAAWNFVLWGVYHGVLLVIWHAFEGLGFGWKRKSSLRSIFSISTTMGFTLFGWILFRCSSTAQIADFARQIMTDLRWTPDAWHYAVPVISSFVLLQAFHYWQMVAQDEFVLLRLPLPQRCAAFTFLFVSIVTVGFHSTPFIYFQF